MIDKKTGLWIYNKMNEIRDFEETAWTLFTENKLRGSVHLYTGEEAVAASVCAQLTDEDLIASTHRGHGHCIAKGAALDRAMAELDAAVLENAADGVSVLDCARVVLAEDITPELLREKLVGIADCAAVVCASKEQQRIVDALAEDVAWMVEKMEYRGVRKKQTVRTS